MILEPCTDDDDDNYNDDDDKTTRMEKWELHGTSIGLECRSENYTEPGLH